ncbi:Putative asparagine synthetase (fragment) [Desulfamplus magnetovallimortis]|uniref:asparagine synthase (glutamine-hydrolyzing) n=1 Tax=Desulfamplus magnetovallimortis TaxID=1246637 RepID=A0A1W1HDZ7_9BACT
MKGLLNILPSRIFFTDKTLIKGIKLFPAAHYATIKTNTLSNKNTSFLDLRYYWDYNFREPDTPSADTQEYVEELDRLFYKAVKRQLVSDVELGAFLSGGMDSGAITAIAAQQLPYIKTFTCGFDLHSASGLELAFDERVMSEYMSYIFKTEHYEMVLKAGDMERVLPKLAWHLEEPRVGQSYPNFYATQLASKFVKVVLSGTGGDELFGGYPWRYYRAVVNDSFEDYVDKYYLFWQRLIPNKEIKNIFSPIWNRCGNVWTKDIFKDVFKYHQNELRRPEDYVNSSLYFEAKTFLHGLLLVEDKLSMAHGLESRVPFLDNELVDFAMQVPISMKLGNLKNVVRLDENEPGKTKQYFQKTRDGKLILRKAMQRYVPKKIYTAIKQGFSAPDASWFKGESIDYVKEQLFNSKARIYDYMDKKAVLSLVNEHLTGKKNRRLLIWSLLNFEWWLKNYMNTGKNNGFPDSNQ